MKKQTSTFIIVSLIAITFIIVGSGFSASRENEGSTNVLDKYVNIQDEEELLKELRSLSANNLVEEIEELSRNTDDPQTLMYHACILNEKVNELSSTEIMSLLLDREASSLSKIVLLQVCKFNDIYDQTTFDELLYDNQVDTEVRQYTLLAVPEGTDTIWLEDLCYDKDEDLAFQALKRLSFEDINRSVKIADEILSNINIVSADKLRIAILTKSKFYEEEPFEDGDQDLDAFIRLCMDIVSKTDDQLLSDAIVTGLSSIPSERAVAEIIKNDKIDNIMKASCVRQNYQMLVKIANGVPSEDEKDLLIAALEIHPIQEVVDAVNAAAKTLEDNRLSSVINDLEKMGTAYSVDEG